MPPTERSNHGPGSGAAGNISNPPAQVITAADEGSAAAIAINADLVDEDLRLAIRDFNSARRPELASASSLQQHETPADCDGTKYMAS